MYAAWPAPSLFVRSISFFFLPSCLNLHLLLERKKCAQSSKTHVFLFDFIHKQNFTISISREKLLSVMKTVMSTPPVRQVRLHKGCQWPNIPLSFLTALFPLIFISWQAYEQLQSVPEGKLFIIQIEAGEKAQITSEATPAAQKEVFSQTMELPWAPPLSPSWATQPELNQSLGSEQPHGWPKCSHHNLIVIVLPSSVRGISFQYHDGIGV